VLAVVGVVKSVVEGLVLVVATEVVVVTGCVLIVLVVVVVAPILRGSHDPIAAAGDPNSGRTQSNPGQQQC
jgi:hypothetical protein